VKNLYLLGRPRPPDNAPLPGPRRSPDSQPQSGYALLPSRIRRHFLIQIDACLSPCLPRRTLLAAQIIKVLDAESLSTRQAEARTGIAHSEFVRIRNVNLARFTIDRLVTILGRLGQEVELTINVRPRVPREVGAGRRRSAVG
jgi:predicted XRE-type DNA-binding protein